MGEGGNRPERGAGEASTTEGADERAKAKVRDPGNGRWVLVSRDGSQRARVPPLGML